MSKKKVFHTFSDAGHGWVRVSVKELVRMGIAHQITPYSYLRGAFAYLEEDCDLSTFVNRKNELGETFSFKEYNSTERQSKIRKYASYDPAVALQALQAYKEAEKAKKALKAAQKAPKAKVVKKKDALKSAKSKAPVVEAPVAEEVEMVTRVNIISGREFQEAADTPLHLSPSSETYHSA